MSSNDNQPTAVAATSLDITEHNLQQLKALFPAVFTEGKIDFDALKAELGEQVETANERYQFTWAGKEQARRIATTPTLGTLRPAPDESVDFDSTENLYIEGDNLEVLKLLQKSYFNQVKMIYIDPPYNTGKDFVYKDDFKDNLANYQRLTGQRDEEGNPLFTNSDSAGRYHSNWLNMMYPRLKLARNLLRDDGVIFISIDDNEVHNLRKICDEIFGEDNFLGTFVINAAPNGRDYGHIAKNHEFCIFYSKNISKCETNFLPDEARVFKFEDEVSGFNIHPLYNSNELFNKNNRPNLFYPFYLYKDSPVKGLEGDFYEIGLDKRTNSIEVYPPLSQKNSVQFVWRWGKQKSAENINKEIMGYITSSGEPRIVQKMRTDEKLIRSIISGREYTSRRGTSEVESLLGGKYFSFPKPLELLKNFVLSGMQDDSLLLDMFAGSSTSADAVMSMNARDSGKRKFIMVQIPEPTPENSEARKAGYATIAEIGKERIRRAASKIQQEHPDAKADFGFKVLKLDSSNIKKWQPDFDNLEQDLLGAVNNILPDRTSHDLLYEVLIKYGLPLTLPVEQIEVAGHTLYNVASGSLIACFDEGVTLDCIQAIIALSTEDAPVLRVVFRDSSFADDIVKTNAIQRFKQAGIEDVLSI